MPVNKNALLRYRILDRCFSDRHHYYDIEELVDKVNEALVHEFNHSFVNPLTDVNSAMIEKAGKNLMKFSEKAMRKNSYNNWQTIINESIVRAAVVLYQLDNGTSADFVRQLVVDEMATGFYWMPDLVDCLQSYSKQRDKYPSLESYYPVIADFFKSYTDELTRKVDTVK